MVVLASSETVKHSDHLVLYSEYCIVLVHLISPKISRAKEHRDVTHAQSTRKKYHIIFNILLNRYSYYGNVIVY